MILRLVRRSLARQPGRSLLLLAGYALGVAVTVTLLSIGDALVHQARDRRLVGGGDLTVIPRGLDLETLKTGGTSSLYFSIDRAPFLYRQVLAGPRLSGRIRAAAPWIEDDLLYLRADAGSAGARGSGRPGAPTPVSAGGRIPSRSRALGAGPRVVSGRWSDVPADRRWMAPNDSSLYAALDRFHLPPPGAARDSSWAEWHYFNLRLPGDRGWLYLTYMVAGDVPDGSWGGRLLATRVDPPAEARVYSTDVPARSVELSTETPDLTVGPGSVRLAGDGTYRLRATIPAAADRSAAPLRLRATVRPAPGRYLPPVDASPGGFPSGYAVPVLRGTASGRICEAGECSSLQRSLAYHDHNWGTWSGVTWDWGQAQAGPYSVVYGRVIGSDRRAAAADGDAPAGFAFVADSLGWLGAFEVTALRYPPGDSSARRPAGVQLVAARRGDTLRLDARVRHVRATRSGPSPRAAPPDSAPATGAGAAAAPRFLQMEGPARLRGEILGRRVEADGNGFYETWIRPTAARGRSARPGPRTRLPRDRRPGDARPGAGTHLEHEGPTEARPRPGTIVNELPDDRNHEEPKR